MPSIPQPLVPDDDGRADAAVAAALAAHAEGRAEAGEVVAALSRARLLVPVVALLTESEVGAHGLKQEKESEMALPKLVGKDGREAVIAFTGVEPLARWRPDARPIQVTGPQVCRAALQEDAAAVVLDVAGPVSFVLEGALLHTLAVMDRPADEIAEALTGAVHGVTVARLGPEEVPARKRRFPWLRRTP
ncbi:SseB protein N-terminal domain-containing protein [Sinosporangium album]|uniref:SseB protein N-terminal domain-containing protein n=1 Tax=Sinosporangium album TaxID=504805 RepID=A0A1G7R8T5_9ACTN|nr:SseB family protein [Sinosporangium album]SDG07182.1 SseB protein N-terminal domain-containing protein [Sinosporangium album]